MPGASRGKTGQLRRETRWVAREIEAEFGRGHHGAAGFTESLGLFEVSKHPSVVQTPDPDADLVPDEQPDRSPFTTALGLQPPWHVAKVELNTGRRRIDFGSSTPAIVPRVRCVAPSTS